MAWLGWCDRGLPQLLPARALERRRKAAEKAVSAFGIFHWSWLRWLVISGALYSYHIANSVRVDRFLQSVSIRHNFILIRRDKRKAPLHSTLRWRLGASAPILLQIMCCCLMFFGCVAVLARPAAPNRHIVASNSTKKIYSASSLVDENWTLAVRGFWLTM